MVSKDRQFLLFRGLVKDRLREKGLKLTGNFGEDNEEEIQKLNERLKLPEPITACEFLELYAELAKEIAEEHLADIQKKIADMRAQH